MRAVGQDSRELSQQWAHAARSARGAHGVTHAFPTARALKAAELREAGMAAVVPWLGVGRDVCHLASSVFSPPGQEITGKDGPGPAEVDEQDHGVRSGSSSRPGPILASMKPPGDVHLWGPALSP